MVEVNCESDFVARTDDFQGTGQDCQAGRPESKPADAAPCMAQPYDAETRPRPSSGLLTKPRSPRSART